MTLTLITNVYTDGRKHKVTYRDARIHLKQSSFEQFVHPDIGVVNKMGYDCIHICRQLINGSKENILAERKAEKINLRKRIQVIDCLFGWSTQKETI